MTTTFQDSLDAVFPGAMRSEEFLDHVDSSVRGLGFTPDRTLPLVSICRDELTSSFATQIDQRWGSAFTLAGLGGVPALGRTGWKAALSHVPASPAERGSVLVFGFPHIGIEDDGSIGATLRRGQDVATPTCGALSAIFDAARSDDLVTEVDVEDYEATKLALRLVDTRVPPGSLVDLTIAALDALEVDLWKALDSFEVWRDHDVAVWCGIQIHGHRDDWIWTRDAWYSSFDGHRRRFNAAAPDDS